MATEMVMAIGDHGAEMTPVQEKTSASQQEPGPQGGSWRAVVFTRNRGVNDKQQASSLVGVTVGTFEDAGKAWEKAKDAASGRDTFGYTIMAEHSNGMQTIEDAEKIVIAARRWTKENVPTEQAMVLEKAFQALSETLCRGWGEVDEALTHLSLAKRSRAGDHFEVAVGMLHRWQGRNGRIGNAESLA